MTTKRKSITWHADQLQRTFEAHATELRLRCRAVREVVGGQPASRVGIESYLKYQVDPFNVLSAEQRAEMADRIEKEEIGKRRNTTPEGGEIQETFTGQITVIRQDPRGHWLGDWMLKAGVKQAASRLGIWSGTRGSKGDMSEGGVVYATGPSLLDPARPYKIYLRDETGEKPAATDYETFRGSITLPKGERVSIVTNAEVAVPGTMFWWRYLCLGDRVSDEQFELLVAYLGNMGVGSARSQERGKYIIEEATLIRPDEPTLTVPKKKEAEKDEKPKSKKSKKHATAA
jgi:hypothetical protein